MQMTVMAKWHRLEETLEMQNERESERERERERKRKRKRERERRRERLRKQPLKAIAYYSKEMINEAVS